MHTFFIIVSEMYKAISWELRLFWQSPRAYLYSYSYSAKTSVRLGPFDPRVLELGRLLVLHIRYANPEIKVHFIGSAVLGIFGQKDIDLYAEGPPKEFKKNLRALEFLFGRPKILKRNSAEWSFRLGDCEVNLLLADPEKALFADPIRTFALIQGSPILTQEYEQLKIAFNGRSVREYKKRRLEFFNRVLRTSGKIKPVDNFITNS